MEEELKKQLEAELAAHDQTKHRLGNAYRKIRELEWAAKGYEESLKKIKEARDREIEKLRTHFLTKLQEVTRIKE